MVVPVNQAEQLALSYCYECIYYSWKSSDSVGVFIISLLPKMIFEDLALPCSKSPATHQELCTRADTHTLVQQCYHPISCSAMIPYASSSHVCEVLLVGCLVFFFPVRWGSHLAQQDIELF